MRTSAQARPARRAARSAQSRVFLRLSGGARRAFTLLEIMISLGIMAIGMSAALGLFTAAAASGRRAEQLVTAAHTADLAFAEVETRLIQRLELDKLPVMDPELPAKLGLETAGGGGDTRVVLDGLSFPESPDVTVWAFLTPLPGQPEPATALFCDVVVQWSSRGKKRGEHFHTVILRRLSAVDLPR